MIHRIIGQSVTIRCPYVSSVSEANFVLLKYIINSFLQLLKHFYYLIKFFFNNEASPPLDRGGTSGREGGAPRPPGQPAPC